MTDEFTDIIEKIENYAQMLKSDIIKSPEDIAELPFSEIVKFQRLSFVSDMFESIIKNFKFNPRDLFFNNCINETNIINLIHAMTRDNAVSCYRKLNSVALLNTVTDNYFAVV